MGDETSVIDYPKRGQRFAVCNSLYNARNKKRGIFNDRCRKKWLVQLVH